MHVGPSKPINVSLQVSVQFYVLRVSCSWSVVCSLEVEYDVGHTGSCLTNL